MYGDVGAAGEANMAEAEQLVGYIRFKVYLSHAHIFNMCSEMLMFSTAAESKVFRTPAETA